MTGVFLPTATLSLVLTLAFAGGPAAGAHATESEKAERLLAQASPISSCVLEHASAAQAAIESRAAEQKAEEAESRKSAEGAASEAPSASAETRHQAQPGTQDRAKRTLTVNGTPVSYVDAIDAPAAPSSGAGLWKGSDSTTDGSFAYFIGHNPGSFSVVAGAGIGSIVTVIDSDGNSRSYTVGDAFTVTRDATWDMVAERVSGHGESVVLQTCVEGGYKILVAS